MRIANPGGIDAFFTHLKNLWLEHNPNVSTSQIPILLQPELQPISIPTPVLQKDSLAKEIKAIAFMKWLAGDLQYTELSSDVDILDHFIYSDLDKRIGCKTAHIRKSPLQSYRLEI